MRRVAVVIGMLASVGAVPAHGAVPGTIDASYGTCGVLRAPGAAAEATPAGGVRATDGGGVAVGTAIDALVSVKLRPDGQPDPSYGTGGVATAQLGGFTRPSYSFADVVAQSGGRIVAAGTGNERNDPGTAQAVLARLNADGSLDASFGTNGVVVNPMPGGKRSALVSIDVDPSGRIVAAGQRDDAFVVARFTADGALDAGFGSGGVATIAPPGTKRAAGFAIRALPDGTVLAGGQADEQFALAKLKADGTPDPGFGTGGVSLESPPASAFITAIEALPDGRVVVAGRGDDINGQEQAVGRVTADGRADPAFARAGFAVTGIVGQANEILVQGDGGLLVTGNGFARYTPAGALDPAFGVGGVFGSIDVGDVLFGQDGSVYGVTNERGGIAFQRHALSGPALAALSQQPALCGLRFATRRIRQLVSNEDPEDPFGSLVVGFNTQEPTKIRWTATVRVGRRTVRLRTVRETWEEAVSDEEVFIPLTRAQRARFAGAKTVHVTVTGRDSAGRAVTIERDLKR